MNQSIIDFQRRSRLGVIEAVWGEHKTIEQISEILKKYQFEAETALVTRLSKEKGEKLLVEFPSAEFHEISGCLTMGGFTEYISAEEEVIILTGGTSDIAVATEAVIVGILCFTYNGGVQSGGVRCSTSIAVPGGIIGSGNSLFSSLLTNSS